MGDRGAGAGPAIGEPGQVDLYGRLFGQTWWAFHPPMVELLMGKTSIKWENFQHAMFGWSGRYHQELFIDRMMPEWWFHIINLTMKIWDFLGYSWGLHGIWHLVDPTPYPTTIQGGFPSKLSWLVTWLTRALWKIYITIYVKLWRTKIIIISGIVITIVHIVIFI